MPSLAERKMCTGCSACLAACPLNALVMREDAEGFLFPKVDTCRCVSCGRCESACPVRRVCVPDLAPTCFAARSNDARIVEASSSGGLFGEFALRVLAEKGVVYGAAYVGEELEVRHIRVDSEGGLGALRGSKYVYSRTDAVYRTVKEDLETRRVLFSGTPCQVAGLKAYLGEDDENLLTVEVICHGTPPGRLFNELKRELEVRNGKLMAISFRDKSGCSGSRAITGWYASGKKIREAGELNNYFKAFLAHLTLRHSCEDCRFNDGRSGADVTLGDFWGVSRVFPDLKGDADISAVILHTDKGRAVFDTLDCWKRPVGLSDITSGNPSYRAPRRAEKHRDAFMALAYREGISMAWAWYCRETRVSLWRRLFGKLMRMVYR